MDPFDSARSGDNILLHQIDDGADVDAANENGDTLLMLAAYHGHADLVRGLIARGAALDRANPMGLVPLAGAVFKRHDAVVAALMAAGADIDAGSPSARETAAQFGLALPVEEGRDPAGP